MKNTIRKQVLLGIIGLLISIGAFLIVITQLSNKWLLYFSLALVTGLCIGCLLYIFGGRDLFFTGLKLGFGFIVFQITINELPYPYNGIFIVLCILSFLGFPIVRDYLYDKERNATTPKSKRIRKKIKDLEEMEKEFEHDLSIIYKNIRYGEKSLLVQNKMGNFYQIIKGDNKYYFVYLGNELSGVDADLLITDFMDENTFCNQKKDYNLTKEEIILISYKIGISNKGDYSILIKTRTGNKRFTLLDTITRIELTHYFSGIQLNGKQIDPISNTTAAVSKSNKKVNPANIAKLKITLFILIIGSILVGAIFLFLGFPYKLLSILCIIIPAITYGIYIKYNGVLTLEDKHDYSLFQNTNIDITLPLFIPSMAMALRSVLDFNILSFDYFFLWSFVLAIMIIAILFLFTSEYKRKTGVIGLFLLFVLFYAPSTVIQINYLFNTKVPHETVSTIYDMSLSEGSRSPDEYIVTVQLSDGRRVDLNISKEYYYRIRLGDTVVILETVGFLKLPYATVKED
ncbi:MAG: hypothetical protein K0S47_4484 [Herbinix sp.]|jgi:hypothetical protein|nr:hypothetical protein [Herbinix sp.]